MDGKILRVHSASVMKWIACFLVAAACQHGGNDKPPPADRQPAARPTVPVTAAYAADIAKLCDAMTQSGADKVDEGPDRNYTIATWLGGHLETKEAHEYLVAIQPLVGEAKAAELETEAKRVGLSGCALAAEWRRPTP